MTGLAEMLRAFWLGVADHLWQTSLVLLLLWVLARVLRNGPARLLGGLWWLGVLKLVLPLPILGALVGRLADIGLPRLAPVAEGASGGWAGVPVLVSPASHAAPELAGGWPAAFWIALTVGWLAVATALLARSVVRAARWKPVRVEAPRRGLDLVALAAGVRPETVRVVDRPGVPAVVGLWRPWIVLPRRLLEVLEPMEAAAILRHEEEHRRRRDPLRYLILEVLRSAYFFYPPAWWLLRKIRDVTESACDEAVLRAGVPAHLYRRTLARALHVGTFTGDAVTAATGRNASVLARRIDRLTHTRRRDPMTRHGIALATGLAAVLVASFIPLAPLAPFSAVAAVGTDELDHLAAVDVPVQANFHDLELRKILQALGEVGSFEVVTNGFAFEAPVTWVIAEKVSMKAALEDLASKYDLTYKVPEPGTLEVSAPLLPGRNGVENPVLIPESRVDPVFPEEMRKAGLGGAVVLQGIVRVDGTLDSLKVLRVRPEEHADVFGASALEAARHWRYRPATLNGVPVPVYLTINVRYHLNGDGEEEKPAA